MKKWILGMLLTITIAFAGIAMPVNAGEAAPSSATVSAVNPITNETITTTNPIVNLDLEYDQTEARKALDYINEFRTSKEDAWHGIIQTQ